MVARRATNLSRFFHGKIIFWRIMPSGDVIIVNMSEPANASDLELLARYTRHHAEDAFATLARRHVDLVYSAALRQVRSPQLRSLFRIG